MKRKYNLFVLSTTVMIAVLAAGSLSAAEPAPAPAPELERDVTEHVEDLGNPMPDFYGERWEHKAGAYDLIAFEGKLYLGHGSTDNTIPTQVIYYDPARGEFDADREEDGSVVAFREELFEVFRIFDDELYIGGYDPINRPSHIYRKEADGWKEYRIGRDAHNRDIYKFDGMLFTNHGRTDVPFPRVLMSADNARTWSLVEQPDLAGEHQTGYMEFFEYRGGLYLTGLSNRRHQVSTDPEEWEMRDADQPWMLRYTGDLERPFEAAFMRRADFFPPEFDIRGFEYITSAVELGDRLIFRARQTLLVADSFDPPQVRVVELPRSPVQHLNVRLHEGHAYVLARLGFDRENQLHHYAMYRTADGVEWAHLFDFQHARGTSHFAVYEGDFYFLTGGHFTHAGGMGRIPARGGWLLRIPAAAVKGL